MSIEAFHISNFMGFGENTDWIELHPITLLFGRNSAGKSAILKAVRMLRQSLDCSPEQGLLILSSSDGVDLGTYHDMIHRHQDSTDVQFGFRCRVDPKLLGWFRTPGEKTRAIIEGTPLVERDGAWADLGLTYGLSDSEPRSIILKRIGINIPWSAIEDTDRTLAFEARWYGGDVGWWFESDFLQQRVEGAVDPVWPLIHNFTAERGFLPFLGDPGKEYGQQSTEFDTIRGLLSDFRRIITSFLESLIYLGPMRAGPSRFHYAPRFGQQRASGRGWSTIYDFLTKWGTDEWDSVLAQVNAHLQETGLKVELKPEPLQSGRGSQEPMFEIKVEELDQAGDEINLGDVGFGIVQVLPVILESVLAGKSATIIIEQPELHLHPGAQALLGDAFVQAANRGSRFLIETHSEHLLLRLRRRIARTTLNRVKRSKGIEMQSDHEKDKELELLTEQLSAYFVERQDGASRFGSIMVDERGQYMTQLDGFHRFFSDDYEQVVAIGQAIAELNSLEQDYESDD